MLGVDEMRAWYGPDHVALAADRGAVGTLLISDALFRYEFIAHLIAMHKADSLDSSRF
jgi:stalled ribosome rescue protein Dom34